MKLPSTHLARLLVSASLLAACGAPASSGPPVAVELPTPPPSPDPAPGADPEPARAKAATPAPRSSARPPQPSAPPRDLSAAAAAQTLFDEGRRLMAQGAYAQACPKLEESLNIDPGIGTLLNLASCEEKAGKRDRACAHYAEAATMCQQSGQPERERLARERLQNLGCQP